MAKGKNEEEESKSAFSLKELPYQVREFWKATGVPIVELTLCIVILSWCTVPDFGKMTSHFDASHINVSSIMSATAMEGEALPPVHTISGVVITGSHAMVTDKDAWMQELVAWIPEVVEHHVPFLGICFGHQLLAKAMGGLSDYHPNGREIGTISIQLTPEGKTDRLLGCLPNDFIAHTTHAQTVIKLPPDAFRLAENSFEIHHAFRLGDSAWGVQFHPEFSADIMRAYVSEQTATLLKEGHNVEELKAAIGNTDAANTLLKRFMTIVKEQA